MDNFQRFVPSFIPGSAQAQNHPELILNGIERFPYALDELGKYSSEQPAIIPIDRFNTETALSAQLRDLFIAYGSDKSTNHAYHLVYGQILAQLGIDNPLNILEIGIGSIDPVVVSNIAHSGKPRASLKAFRDAARNSQIYGADIDPKVLFTDERIQTAWVDQMDTSSFARMNQDFGNIQYDLIIDDGLHAVAANINTLLFGLSVLKQGGWIVIEDIWAHKVCWTTIFRLLPASSFNKYLISCAEGCYLFVLQKK